jgi:transcription antitermination factor NusG
MKLVVLRVRSRAEKKVRYLCRQYKIICYIPTYFKSKKYQRRNVTNEFPLFPGYVFVSLNDDLKQKRLLASGLITSIIPVPNQRELIRQLKAIKKLLISDNTINVSSHKIGDEVAIITGSLQGTHGVVERIDNNRSKIFLNIDIIGRAVVVEIDNDNIETVE